MYRVERFDSFTGTWRADNVCLPNRFNTYAQAEAAMGAAWAWGDHRSCDLRVAAEMPDDDVMERHAREDWLAFQRDLESDWRL